MATSSWCTVAIGSTPSSMTRAMGRDKTLLVRILPNLENEIRLDCLLQQSEDQGMNPVTPTNISGTVPAEINYKLVKPFEPPQTISQNISSTKEKVLYFDSKFECGNLLNVYKHKNKDEPFTYSMFIQNDTNTIGYNQWFYFSVRNAEKGLKYHFKIVNFVSFCLINRGKDTPSSNREIDP
jgi:hypothetical protein